MTKAGSKLLLLAPANQLGQCHGDDKRAAIKHFLNERAEAQKDEACDPGDQEIDGDCRAPRIEAPGHNARRAQKGAGESRQLIGDACFLFSYLNPAHKDRVKAIVSEILPEAFVTTSSFVSPQFHEFERFTTAALAAFIGPKVRMYITHLDRSLKSAGLAADLRIMASNGGVAPASMVSEKPTLTLLSGLAAGVLAGAWIGELAERRKLITFDIGGMSAEIGIIVDGKLAETDARSTSIAGFPLLTPMIDIHTIGAGGGSIAYIDHGGAFRVGPRSAGAAPGPAAYGMGGEEPTVTDANLVLGRLDADDFLGGGMKLDAEAARRAVGGLAVKLGLSLSEAAEGVLTVINANMANAIRSRTIQKGIDPRGFSLVAFGGAGPLEAAEVAAVLGIPEVIAPPYPGITSAMGLRTTDFKYDSVQTEFQVSGAIDLKKLNRSLAEMQAGLVARFEADHIPLSEAAFSRAGDLRYVGQGYELRVPLPEGEITEETLPQAWKAFHAAHAAEYGRAFEASPIEIVNVRVSGVGRVPKLRAMNAPKGGSLEKAKARVSPCLFRSAVRSRASTRPSTGAASFRWRRSSPVPRSSCKQTAPRSSRPAQPPAWTRPAISSSRSELCNDGSFRGRAGSPACDPRQSGDCGRHPRRARKHRHRDGPQAHANCLFQHRPRVRRFRRRADRPGGGPALRVQDEHPAPVRADPRIHPRDPKGAGEARRSDLSRRCHHAQRPLWGASHGPDVAFCAPVFLDGQSVGFSVTIAHHLDIGASTPGSAGIVSAVDAYAEGLQFKAIKIVEDGRPNRAV